MRRTNANYESDDQTFPPDARYRVARWPAVAVYVLGWETEPDEDSEWSGYETRTGSVLVTMVGDDARHSVDPDDLELIPELAYCAVCGQIGCGHDGRDRD